MRRRLLLCASKKKKKKKRTPFTPAQTNHTKGVDAPGFDSTDLNKADVKTPIVSLNKTLSKNVELKSQNNDLASISMTNFPKIN